MASSDALSADARSAATTSPATGGLAGAAVLVDGVLVGGVLPDPAELGVDAIFPAFFLCLLVGEVRGATTRRPLVVVGLSVAITLVLLPWAPAGVPVIAGSAAALIGLSRR